MGRLGVSEVPAAIAVAILAALQYVFLAQLWRGFPLKALDNNAVHVNVVVTGIAVTLAGAATMYASDEVTLTDYNGSAWMLSAPTPSDAAATRGSGWRGGWAADPARS